MIDGKFYAIDAHCHIYPEKIAAKAVAGTDRFYGTVAAHNGTVSDLLQSGMTAGVDHFVVQSVATTPKQVRSINEFIASEVEKNGGLLTGLGTLHPESEDIAGDVEYLRGLGLKGVKLHPDIQGFKIDDYRCLKIYELCEKYGLPLLLHTGDYRYDNSNPNRLKPILGIYENMTVIGAHFGGWSVYEHAAEELAGIKNLYVDCSSSMQYLTPEKTVRIIRHYGADRVLFGTDYPMWDTATEVKALLSLGLTDEELEKIFSKNAIKVYNIH